MVRNGKKRATKRRRTNEGKAVDIVRKALTKTKRKRVYRGKRKFNRKYGYDKRVMSRRALEKVLTKVCIPPLNLRLGSHSGLAPIHRCMQRVYKRIVITADGTNTHLLTLNANSTYDPMNDSAATQAPGRDLLATIYESYIVLNARVSIRATYDEDDTATVPLTYWMDRGLAADQADTLDKAEEYGNKRAYFVTNSNVDAEQNPKGKFVSIKFRDFSKWLDTNNLGLMYAKQGVGAVGGDPNVNATVRVYLTENDGTVLANTSTQSFDCYITQEVVYFGLQSAVQDS